MITSLKEKLKKTYTVLHNGITNITGSKQKLSEEDIEAIECILIQADIGFDTSEEIIQSLRSTNLRSEEIIQSLKSKLSNILSGSHKPLNKSDTGPTVILILGVNGTGKTTTLAKLTHKLQSSGNSVILGACDTFRPAAIEQLENWAKKLNVDIIKQQYGTDPAAIAYDAFNAAKKRKKDYLLLDTAGRFHSRIELVEELKKIVRVINKLDPSAPHEKLLVIDATTGQNAYQQAKSFNQAVDLTGIITAKLDGTAKGGIIIHIYKDLCIPIKYIGIGQEIDDLEEYNPEEYINALL